MNVSTRQSHWFNNWMSYHLNQTNSGTMTDACANDVTRNGNNRLPHVDFYDLILSHDMASALGGSRTLPMFLMGTCFGH